MIVVSLIVYIDTGLCGRHFAWLVIGRGESEDDAFYEYSDGYRAVPPMNLVSKYGRFL